MAARVSGVSAGAGGETTLQAEVMIVTGAHSALDYLMAPLMKSFDRAFRES